VNQKLERLSIDPESPHGIILENSPETRLGQVDNEVDALELVDAWNALVAATSCQS
jgi:hypothetical protein